MVSVVHRLKGRVRLKGKPLYRNKPLCLYLEESLSALPSVKSVSANPLTGSLLVYFDEALSVEELTSKVEFLILNFKPIENSPKGSLKKASLKRANKPLLIASFETQSKPWHLMSASQVLDYFQVDPRAGLDERTASARLNQYGPNQIPDVEPRSRWEVFLSQFKSLPIILLSLSSLFSIATGGLVDGIAILGAVFINSIIGYMTEYQSERLVFSLKSLVKPMARVLREGKERIIGAEEVVPGDILILKPGQYVPADARVVESHQLTVDESALTGESLPVVKTSDALSAEPGIEVPLADRVNMVYAGTFVTSGYGLAVVVATGVHTELGKIQLSLREGETEKAPFEVQLEELSRKFIIISGGFCGLVFALGLLRGYGFFRVMKLAVSLAVAAIPEGLPTVATTTLALGVKRMKSRGILVRKLSAVDTLGKVQVICLDKTGTLTMNKMSVDRVYCGSKMLYPDDLKSEEKPELKELLKVLVLCNEAIVEYKNGKPAFTGSPTEVSLLELAHKAGIDIEKLRTEYPLLFVKHRTDRSLYMATVHAVPSEPHKKYIAVKGSPLEVLNLCSHRMVDGWILEFSEEDKEVLVDVNEELAYQGLRVLGVAFAESMNTDCFELENDLYEGKKCNFVWLGLVALVDPIRPGAKEFIRRLHEAGIETVMITGDQAQTGYAVAKELNLSNGEPIEVFDSSKVDLADPEVLSGLSRRVHCFTRVSPAQKLYIVKALKRAGKTVAMIGDGINDGPSLKAADVGISLGIAGTDVARSVADVIIEDDNLERLLEAIELSRNSSYNINRVVHYLLSTNLSEMVITPLALGLGVGEPFTPIQLLWINLITDTAPGLALALEPPEEDLMKRPPKDPKEPIISNEELKDIFLESLILSGSGASAYLYGLLRFGQNNRATGLAFTSFTLAEVLHALTCRSKGSGPNRHLFLTIVGSLMLQGLALAFPPLRSLLGLKGITAGDAVVALGGAVFPFLLNQSLKKSKTKDKGENHEERRLHLQLGVGN